MKQKKPQQTKPDIPSIPRMIAAVDLGSNSVHLIVAQIENGQMQIMDRLKEMVRLGAGLDEDKQLDEVVRQRALDCLSRFGQRLQDLPKGSVRAVGTNTLRQLRDGGRFLQQAQNELGHPIDIIAGREEARLVYLGVAHGLAADEKKRLVVDIGGGSTELIIGKGMKPKERESLFMGCVSYSRKYFPDGSITSQAMKHAIVAGRLEIRPHQGTYNSDHWEKAVGSSGTIRAIRDVIHNAGWSSAGISKKSLKKLRRHLVKAGHCDNLKLEGLSDERRPVFAGGVAVLSAVFKGLDIKRMRVSELALREGLLYELLGSIQHHDVRNRTVDTLISRYGLDKSQGALVAESAIALLQQVAGAWELDQEEFAQLLTWSSKLHEVGLAISHSGFQKHGAYILANADRAGFSRQQQLILSTLVRAHRRKFPINAFAELHEDIRQQTIRLSIILRLAVLLHRGRSHARKPRLNMQADGNDIRVIFPENWLNEHPLTLQEMKQEAEYLGSAGVKLVFG